MLVRTSGAPVYRDALPRMLKLSNGDHTKMADAASLATETTAYVDVDWPNRSMAVSQVVDGKTIWLRQDLPTDKPAAVWRPCVVMAGGVSATILAWTDSM